MDWTEPRERRQIHAGAVGSDGDFPPEKIVF